MKPLKTYTARILTAFLSLCASISVFAHSGHEHAHADSSAFWQGLTHPVSGLDHILLAIGLGLLLYRGVSSGGIYGALVLAISLVFGFSLAFMYPFSTTLVEGGILASVLLVAAALFWGKKSAILFVMGTLAVFHGMAHGMELPAGAIALEFVAGMLLSMLGLYALGLIVGKTLLASLADREKNKYLSEKILAILGVGMLFLG